MADTTLKLLDNLKIKQGLPCGVVVCFPNSNFHVVGIEPGISRRGEPSIWNALEKHSSAKWTDTRHKLSARVEVHAVSVHVCQPLISLTFYCGTKMSRNTCIHIWSIAASVCYTSIGHDSIRIERQIHVAKPVNCELHRDVIAKHAVRAKLVRSMTSQSSKALWGCRNMIK